MRKAVITTPRTREFVEQRGGILVISRQAIMMG